MAVIRVNKTADYTVMSNEHFRNKQMSLKAKGLLSLMLSLPNEWDYSIAGLVTLSADGKDSVIKALKELKELGYVKQTRTTDDKGRFAGYNYDIYEAPQTEKPYAEKPNTEKPYTENPPQLNTKQLNTNNNKILIKDIVDYLNEKAGTSYRTNSKETQKHINARMKDGFTIEDFKIVIDKKCNDWLNDPKMKEYLRPSTLFGTKFEQYRNSVNVATIPQIETFSAGVIEL